MMGWLAEWGNAIWAFFGIEKNSTAVMAIVAVLGAVGAVFLFFWRRFRSPEGTLTIKNEAPSEPMVNMTLAQFEERQRQLRDEITAKLQNAHAEDRARLQAELDEVNARLRAPEKALEEAKDRITSLEAKLAREANSFGAERIEKAKDALRRFDYSVAEALFDEIRKDAQIAVQAAARAEYGLGEIAEAQVNWAGAARHYRRAAELEPSMDNLYKAAELTMNAGDYATALSLSTRHLDLAETGTAFQHGRALNLQAMLLQENARYEEAERFYRQAIDVSAQALGDKDPNNATALGNLAGLLKGMGRYEEAEPLFRRALKIDQATLGEQHPSYATGLNNLANLLRSMGRYEEVEPLFRQVLEIDQATLGEQHPTYATHLSNLAGLLKDMGRYEEAESFYRQALGIGQVTLGEQHPNYAIYLNNLAGLLQDMGHYEEAELLYRQALEIDPATIGEQHPDYATHLNNLAVLFASQGKWAEAEPLVAQALDIFKATLPADHPNIAQLEKDLATIRKKLGKGN